MSSAASVAISEEQDERYYRIGEVSRITEVRPFVLRYWEEEFPMLQPVKGRQGHRLYRQEDVDLVLKIKRLLYDEGFTIAGARRHLREHAGMSDSETAGSSGGSIGLGRAAQELAHADSTPQLLNRKMLLDLRDSLR